VRPYTEPVRRERVDAHLVLSNEAWYRTSFEFDQMMAFSKVLAAATGRSVVRCTNSGVTAVVGPDGRETQRLVGEREDGVRSDRASAGWLLAEVPVPAPDAGAPPYTALGAGFSLGLAALGILAGPLALVVGRGAGRGARAPVAKGE
jgi:apolipoprotein N-acyltransferase